MKRKLMLLLTLLVMSIGWATAQTSKVSGVVTAEEDGLPVVGASVLVKGTTVGTVTDIDGKFNLTNVPSSAKTLVVSYIGMKSQELAIKQNMSIVLKGDAAVLEEVVVTGYGVTKKAAFTGAATTVATDKIINKTDANPIKALEGTVAGLQLNVASGQPGAPANIFIRGRNSINSGTQPLYIVDGVPYNSATVGVRSDEGQETSPLANLNANDIESMTVLKDATATSIYGARAANGVIVITTKKGKSGKTKVNFSAKVGVQMMPAHKQYDYSPVSADKYKEMWLEAMKNEVSVYGDDSTVKYYMDGLGLNYDEAGYTEFLNWGIGNTSPEGTATNWLDEVTRNGLTQEYSLDIQGGSNDPRGAKYFLSLNYLNDKAIVNGKDLKRYSFRYNFDQAPSKSVKYGFNTNFVYSETNMGSGGGYFTDPITQAFMQSPITSVKNTDGSWNFATVNGYNPVAIRSELGDQSLAKQYRILLSPYVQINFTPELYFMSRGGADIYLVDEFGFWSFLQPQGSDMRGMGENNNTTRTLLSITNTLNYIKTFNEKHNINVLLGQEAQYTYLKEAYLSGSNYPVDYLPQVSNTAVPGSASTRINRVALASFFANAEYDYNSKYYASASFRMDGSSRFGKNNRWAPFFSVGAKYRISDEAFLKDNATWLNNLTLRASYGTSGNSEVGASWYASRDLFGFGYNYNGIPGMAHEQFGNEDLKWERTQKFNFGIDITFLDRFTVEMDYYNHRTTDMVFAVPTSFVTGLDSYYKNIGELKNTGFEATLTAQIINTKDLSWNVTLVGSHNKNKVVKLSTDNPIETTYQITEVGKPLYQFKMKEFAGVDPQTGNPTWYLNETGDETTTNYNKATKRYLGSANPDFLGSLSSTLNYKGFDVSFQMNYSLGGKIYGNNLRYDEQIGGSFGENFTEYVYKNRWQKPGDITDVPKLTAFGSSNKASSQFLMDGDYLKIRSLTVGYTLPTSWTEKAFISRLRLYVQADNIYTFGASNYRGFDPSGIGANGVQWWNFPSPRNIVFGANVSF
ncbi:SusC/RagA family TonB-linked outer membrane protein [Phocaeicola paurosaccharolyticus]|uniref:SusC/RagA family TonB-linked outer membrane protein n=2 Tax=Phocaeicola paurosaccharolyticus TaxID=732242 RepID=UPI0004693040|nr:TonB-dependent receptor [Phocaeicola paurosaccharolyticus]